MNQDNLEQNNLEQEAHRQNENNVIYGQLRNASNHEQKKSKSRSRWIIGLLIANLVLVIIALFVIPTMIFIGSVGNTVSDISDDIFNDGIFEEGLFNGKDITGFDDFEDGFYYEDPSGVITVFPDDPSEGGYEIVPNEDGSATVRPITEEEFFNGGQVETID